MSTAASAAKCSRIAPSSRCIALELVGLEVEPREQRDLLDLLPRQRRHRSSVTVTVGRQRERLRLELGLSRRHRRGELGAEAQVVVGDPAGGCWTSPFSIAAISSRWCLRTLSPRRREVREQRHEAAHAVAHRVDQQQHDLVARQLRDRDVEVEVELEQLERAGRR